MVRDILTRGTVQYARLTTRDCQSISDGLGYSDKGYYTICMADDSWLTRDSQSNSEQGYISRIVMELSDKHCQSYYGTFRQTMN